MERYNIRLPLSLENRLYGQCSRLGVTASKVCRNALKYGIKNNLVGQILTKDKNDQEEKLSEIPLSFRSKTMLDSSEVRLCLEHYLTHLEQCKITPQSPPTIESEDEKYLFPQLLEAQAIQKILKEYS